MKEQAASITRAKVTELCQLIPGLGNELNLERGKTKSSKTDVEYIFKNGSTLDILAASQATRGQRRVGGLMEEVILIDQDTLNEIIIPTLNIDRLLPDGRTRQPMETVNKSQIYITTAGWKNSFPYQKLVEILIKSILYPHEAIVIGGTWHVPVMEGLISKTFVQDLKLAGTYNDASFSREYESQWSGDAENSFFSAEVFDKYRVLVNPEWEYTDVGKNKNMYYVLGVDVGRLGCNTEVCVIKVLPQPGAAAQKNLVNIYTYEAEDFEMQAINIKRLFFKYRARRIVIDANGIGLGLLDFMIKSQTDPKTKETFPPFGIENDELNLYKKFRTPETIVDAIYQMKANAPINTEAHTYVQTSMSSGKMKFLVDEITAKQRLMETKAGMVMEPSQRAIKLQPFVLTTVLREQLLNLAQKNEGVNIILSQTNKKILKDKFSALEYAMYYIKQEEERRLKRRGHGLGNMLFFS